MPEQKPGRSVQEVGTPPAFLDAVAKRFGAIYWDLAANASNHVVPGWFGPGSPYCYDSLSDECEWDINGLQFLNPPYANIGDWAKKCASYEGTGALIAMLIPAAVGTNYFREYIADRSLVLFLSPRLTFVNHMQSYPKDLILCVYGVKPGYQCWRWKP